MREPEPNVIRKSDVVCLLPFGSWVCTYTTEGDMVYGMGGSDSRNERMILKVVAHLGDSSHKCNPVALS